MCMDVLELSGPRSPTVQRMEHYCRDCRSVDVSPASCVSSLCIHDCSSGHACVQIVMMLFLDAGRTDGGH